MKLFVGISGPIAAGKSTLAKKLCTILTEKGYNVEVIAFASGIRDIITLEDEPLRSGAILNYLYNYPVAYDKAVRAAISIDAAMAEYPSKPGIKNRRLMQIIGTEIGRDIVDKDIWIRIVQQKAACSNASIVISDDLRFDNEAKAVDMHIGIQSNQRYTDRITELDPLYLFSDHASERSLTIPPMFSIPCGFTSADVQQLALTVVQAYKLK